MRFSRVFFLLFFLSIHFFSCQSSSELPLEDDIIEVPDDTPTSNFISATDISFYPRIATKGLTFFNRSGESQDFLQILKDNGVNTIRLRIWHTPADEHASFQEVESFSKELKALGFKVWLTVHYSDYWADPGKQVTPKAWENLTYGALRNQVYNYTQQIMQRIQPDIIQIGNEVDNGFLHPIGNIHSNQSQFIQLLSDGIRAVRDHDSETKIMIHKADPASAVWFYNLIKNLDYDLIGLSYYPQWHGKDLDVLKSQLQAVDTDFRQDVVLAETSYPFSLGWVDQDTNVIGSTDQILADFPASFSGQRNFLAEMKSIVLSLNKGVGLGYWGAEWVAFEGPNATNNGSVWENQALFDFSLKATPALEVFKNN